MILSSGVVFADEAVELSKFSDEIQEEAQRNWDAFVKNDVDTQMSYLHPLVFVLNGGKEEGKAVVRQALIDSKKRTDEDMKAQGSSWAPIEIGEPTDFHKINDVIYALVPETIKEESFDGWDTTETYVLAVSEDEGDSWTFTDVYSMDEVIFYKMFPDIEGVIEIPPRNEDKFIPKPGQPQYGT